jgi:hypothetical protein
MSGHVTFGTILHKRRLYDEICALLGYYAASNGNPLPTFRDNVSIPSLRVKKSSWTPFLLERLDP